MTNIELHERNLGEIKFVLHIGVHKTGSSAIQEFFTKYRDYIRRKFNILYPLTGIIGPAHYLFPYSIIPWGKRRHGSKADVKRLKDSLYEEIYSKGPRLVVISCEDFSHFNKDLISEFKKLYDLPITEIVCYVRRQDLAVESIYRENVKNTISKYKSTFEEFIAKNYWGNSKLNYYTYLSYWKQAFPEAKIIPRIYDRKLFPHGNVILDFLSVLGIDMPEAREYKIEANPSLSHLSALVLRRINEEFDLSNEDHRKVVNYLLHLDKQEGSPIKTFFTLQERIEFLERFRESNEKLFREYFGTENKFVLSEDEIKFYKEQDKIPREVVEKAVEERYRKVLEFMRANGILMKEKLFPKVHVNYFSTNLEFFRIDVLQANLLNGRLTVGGLILPSKDSEEVPKLTIKDAEGMKEVQWGLPSPFFGEQRKDNLLAKNARFIVDGVVVGYEPIEMFVDGNKVAEIRIER